MEESGVPVFITVLAAAVLLVGVIVGMAAVTWIFLLS
jgi:hypothetical protein